MQCTQVVLEALVGSRWAATTSPRCGCSLAHIALKQMEHSGQSAHHFKEGHFPLAVQGVLALCDTVNFLPEGFDYSI